MIHKRALFFIKAWISIKCVYKAQIKRFKEPARSISQISLPQYGVVGLNTNLNEEIYYSSRNHEPSYSLRYYQECIHSISLGISGQ
jgi:hypothetical protein